MRFSPVAPIIASEEKIHSKSTKLRMYKGPRAEGILLSIGLCKNSSTKPYWLSLKPCHSLNQAEASIICQKKGGYQGQTGQSKEE